MNFLLTVSDKKDGTERESKIKGIKTRKIFKDVKILYGPYNFFGITQHRTERLEGLVDILKAYGHTVHLVPIPYLNLVELWVYGRLVLSLDITNLDYGGDGMLDCVCLKALETVNMCF